MIWGVEIGPAVLSVVATVAGGIILAWLQPKVKIIWSEPHLFTFLVRPPDDPPQPAFSVSTRTVFVQNAGRQSANGVEVILNWEPDTYNVWPTLPYQTETIADGRFVIRVQNLGKREWFRIEMLSSRELPQVVRVRSPDGVARQVEMGPMRIMPHWFNLGILVLTVIGIFAIIYHLIEWLLRAVG